MEDPSSSTINGDCSSSDEDDSIVDVTPRQSSRSILKCTLTSTSSSKCLVCGEKGASMHYGALSCVGCKGFFRRALKKADQIECSESGTCDIVGERACCRGCRLKKCLEVGMKPSAVRPDRPTPLSYTSKRTRKNVHRRTTSKDGRKMEEKNHDEEWTKRLSVEMKTMLMTLLNLEMKITKGDTTMDASMLYPLGVNNLRDIIDHPETLKGKRSRMRYEHYRMAANNELQHIAYRRLIATIDWVEFISELIEGGLSAEDKMALIRSSFAPLMVFAFSARTSQVTKDEDVLCLCNFAYVPREIGKKFADAYHLGNGLVGRTLDELVRPYRQYGITEEEYVCVSAIIVLNPLAKDLSEEGQEKIFSLRHRIQDVLFAVVKEAKQPPTPSVTYGNLLLSLVAVSHLANAMCENLQFALTFSSLGGVTLLTNLFGCFPVEPFTHQLIESGRMNKETQTILTVKRRKRIEESDSSPQEDHPRQRQFRLLSPPGHFTLTEMFDDLQYGYSNEPSTSQYPLYQCNDHPSHLNTHFMPLQTVNNHGNSPLFQSTSKPNQVNLIAYLSSISFSYGTHNLRETFVHQTI